MCQVNGELVNTAHSDAGKTRHGAGYFYPTFIEHISLALAVSSRYTHHNKNKNATNLCLDTYCKVCLIDQTFHSNNLGHSKLDVLKSLNESMRALHGPRRTDAHCTIDRIKDS